MTAESILHILKTVTEPELQKGIVALDMVKNVKINDKQISFTLEMHNAVSPHKQTILEQCEQAIKQHYPSATIHIHISAKHSPFGKTTAPESLVNEYSTIKNIIAVASGKGGVGKSTVAVNTAIALAQKGLKVGIMDADVYGPSLPTMLGLRNKKPMVQEYNGIPKILPMDAHGVKSISIGYLIDEQQAVILRGPRLSAIIKQFFQDVIWGELDYLIIDLPPGTGDIQLTLAQSVPITGALIVSTPQQVAVADAQKAVSMFLLPNIAVPILGLVVNMSYFTPAELPNNKYYIFGKDAVSALALREQIDILAEIPLIQSIAENSDAGTPSALQQSITQELYAQLAEKLLTATERRNAEKPQTKVVQMQV